MNSRTFRWRDYTCSSGDYYGLSTYIPIKYHEQAEPPKWVEYRSLLRHHDRFAELVKHGEAEERWQRRAWYAERERSREQLDRLALEILNPK